MPVFSALILFLLLLLLVFGIRALRRLERERPEQFRKLLKAGGIGALVLLALRLGSSAFYNLLWLLYFLIPFFRRSQYGSQQTAPPPSSDKMTLKEACSILGVDENATEEQINTAWRRMMQKNHPDQGGSDYLAAKINQARDVLRRRKGI